MKVKRIICPSCKSEEKEVSDEDNLRDYTEELVSKVCSKEECKKWYDSAEQRMIRAIFGKGGE